MARRRPPALGEGAAAAGYRYQYLVTAFLVLRRLRDDSLGWVRIKDVDAGRVDDFVVGSDNRVDGYQVKHRARPLTFRSLTRAEQEAGDVGGAEPLIRQLADGWQRLRERHGPRVVVHLVTNARASIDDRIDSAAAEAGPRHFAAFLSEAWQPFRQAPSAAGATVPAKWTRTWEELRHASGLTDEAFAAFVRDC